MQLIPRDEKFYELFRLQAENVCDAGRKLVALLESMEDVERQVTEIKFVEHKGDQMTHDLIMRLNKTFLTHDQILGGGELVFEMTSAPDSKWGTGRECRPGSALSQLDLAPLPENASR